MSTGTLTEAEILEIENYLDYDDNFEFRHDYNGRGMYRQTCIAFIMKQRTLPALGVALAYALGMPRANHILAACRIDDMALDIIVYFPGWTLAENETSKDGDPK